MPTAVGRATCQPHLLGLFGCEVGEPAADSDYLRSSYSSSKNGKSWCGSPLTLVTRLLLAKHREADDQGQVVQLGAFLLGHFVAQCSNACLEQITWSGLNG